MSAVLRVFRVTCTDCHFDGPVTSRREPQACPVCACPRVLVVDRSAPPPRVFVEVRRESIS